MIVTVRRIDQIHILTMIFMLCADRIVLGQEISVLRDYMLKIIMVVKAVNYVFRKQ